MSTARKSLGTHLQELRASGRKLLLPFFTAGYPDMPTFSALLSAAEAAGADAIEIGLPFSDPLADGPAIQLSSTEALKQGVTIEAALKAAAGAGTKAPLITMTYINPVLACGAGSFAIQAAAAGISGAIFPDLPLGEEGAVGAALAQQGIDLIRLVAPTTPDERIARICQAAQGFVYLVSVAGVTGARTGLPEDLPAFVQRVRRHTDLPLLIGFGISTPALAAEAAALADGVIVGSALVNLISSAASPQAAVDNVSQLLSEMRGALDSLPAAQTEGVTP
ncbi:tryptophan synthase subunit alpha [bacterium]|nr:tryptophan synthase subunit alpha [bacterium]